MTRSKSKCRWKPLQLKIKVNNAAKAHFCGEKLHYIGRVEREDVKDTVTPLFNNKSIGN